jgi:hypothetical protein
VPLGELPDAAVRELVADCTTALSSLQAVMASAVGVFDARCLAAGDGAVNTPAWLRQRDLQGAGRVVRTARALRDKTPAVAAALAAGEISYDKAALIAGAVPDHLADAFALSEAAIVEAATQLPMRDTAKLLASWRAIAEDDAGISPDERNHDQRRGRWTETLGGNLELDGRFDPLLGAPMKAALDAREREMFLADLAEARALAGVAHDPDDPSTAGLTLPRTVAQRRADAICELIIAGAGLDDTHGVGGAKTVVNVTTSAEELAAAAAGQAERTRRAAAAAGLRLPGLGGDDVPGPVSSDGSAPAAADPDPNAVLDALVAGGRDHHRVEHAIDAALDPHHTHGTVIDDHDTPIGRDLLGLLACDCILRRITLDANGVPIDLGRDQRLVSRHQRRLLRQRDGGCAFPGCDRPPSWCDAHHIIPWEIGGPTDLDNLVLLCRKHHGYMHRRDPWVCRINPDTRRPEFFDPDGNRVLEPVWSRPPGRAPDGRPPDPGHDYAPAA